MAAKAIGGSPATRDFRAVVNRRLDRRRPGRENDAAFAEHRVARQLDSRKRP
jgi:hypothetical protein